MQKSSKKVGFLVYSTSKLASKGRFWGGFSQNDGSRVEITPWEHKKSLQLVILPPEVKFHLNRSRLVSVQLAEVIFGRGFEGGRPSPCKSALKKSKNETFIF